MRVPIVNRNSPGQMSDPPAELLPPEAWTVASNVRFRNGVAERMAGEADMVVPGAPPAYQMFPFRRYQADNYVYFCSTDKIHISDGITTNDRTGTPTPAANVNDWQFTNFNNIPVLNEGNVPPKYQAVVPGGDFATIPNWPAGYTCEVIRGFKNFLVALNVTKTGVTNPQLVLWSHPATPGALPASWDVANPAVLAGENPLADNDDDEDIEIVDGATLKDAFMIYKRESTVVMSLGGPNIFTFTKTLDKGAIGKNCVVRPLMRDQHHVVFGLDDIFVHNGVVAESVIEDRLRTWLYTNMNPELTFLCHATHNKATGECWFMFPMTGALWISHALVWNYKKNNISIVEIPDTYSVNVGAFTVTPPGLDTWDGGDEAGWDELNDMWDASPAVALRRRFLQARTDGQFFLDMGVPKRTALLERQGLTILGRAPDGTPIYDTEVVKKVTAMWPRFEGTGTVTAQIGVSDTPSDLVTWGPPRIFQVAGNAKLDCYEEGRILHTRFIATDTGQWRMLGYDLEIEAVGQERMRS